MTSSLTPRTGNKHDHMKRKALKTAFWIIVLLMPFLLLAVAVALFNLSNTVSLILWYGLGFLVFVLVVIYVLHRLSRRGKE